MMSKFKVGDEVKCIDSQNSDLFKGKSYIVFRVTEHYVHVTKDNGAVSAGYYPNRFQLMMDERQELSDAIDLLAEYNIASAKYANGFVYYIGEGGGKCKEVLLNRLFPKETPAQKKLKELEEQQRKLADQIASVREELNGETSSE